MYKYFSQYNAKKITNYLCHIRLFCFRQCRLVSYYDHRFRTWLAVLNVWLLFVGASVAKTFSLPPTQRGRECLHTFILCLNAITSTSIILVLWCDHELMKHMILCRFILKRTFLTIKPSTENNNNLLPVMVSISMITLGVINKHG